MKNLKVAIKHKMASESSNEIAALYPPAPPYLKFFTQENLEKIEEYKKTKQKNSEVASDNEDEIHCELDFLIPPPIPKSGHYRAFGSVWQIKDHLPSLESLGMTQLYKVPIEGNATSYQYKINELHKLLKSLLLNFLELVGILSINPEKFPEKVENIRTILVNIHHLLNEYRPHQSRESLIMLLEEQLEYKKQEIENIKEVCAEVREKLQKMNDIYIQGSNEVEIQDKSEIKMEIDG